MRGKVDENFCDKAEERITPAYAGKSNCNFSTVIQPEDHPRICGEKTKRSLKYRHLLTAENQISFSLR